MFMMIFFFFLEMIVNPENSFKYLKNLQLNKGQEYKEAVQVKPQHVQLKLRTSEYYFLGFTAMLAASIYNLMFVSNLPSFYN